MIKGGSLKFLVPLAVVATIATVALYQQQERRTGGRFEPRKLLPDLDIGAIQRVEIRSDEADYALVGSGESWSLESFPGFPIDENRLRELILALAGLEASDRMTQRPENYERLGVDDPPAAGRVTLLGPSGSALADVFIGEERRGRPASPGGFSPADGQYVRLVGDPWVYKVGALLTIDLQPRSWLQRDVLKVETGDLRSVRIDNAATTESFSLARSGSAAFELQEEIPEGMRVKNWAVDNVARALANLTQTDVLAVDDDAAAALDFDGRYTATLKNGVSYVAATAQRDEAYYARIGAVYDPAANLGLSDERTSDSVRAQRMEDPELIVQRVAERHDPWIYQISEFAYENLTKRRSALLEPVPDPAAEDPGDPDFEAFDFDFHDHSHDSDEDIEAFLRQLQSVDQPQ
jgi:hypothetical protein